MYCQKQAHLKRKTARFEQRRMCEPKCVLLKSGTLLKPQGYSHKTAQCSYKNVDRFTILRVILAQGLCQSSLYRSNFSICTSTLEMENSEIWTKEEARWEGSEPKMCFIKTHLCIVPILVYVLPKQAHLKGKTARFEQGRRREPKCVLLKIWNLVKTTRIFTQNSTVQLQKCGMLHDFACHPCAGAMLIFSVSFLI